MTVTLNLPPDVEQALLAEAHARGLSLDALVHDKLTSDRSITQPSGFSTEGKKRKFEEWVASHRDITVVLPDEAMERESIYGDHGR